MIICLSSVTPGLLGAKTKQFIYLPSIKIVIPSASWMMNDISWTRNKRPRLSIVLSFSVGWWRWSRLYQYRAWWAQKGRRRGRKARPSLFPFLSLTYAFDASYAGYLLKWWPYWFQVYWGVTQLFKNTFSTFFYFAAIDLFALRSLVDYRRYRPQLEKWMEVIGDSESSNTLT